MTMNFAHLYKSAAETTVKLITTNDKNGKSKRKKLKSNLVTPDTAEEIDVNNADENQPLNNVSNKKAKKKDKAKSAHVNNPEVVTNTENGEIKPKKRNKSVSFMLEDKEEVAVKKTKSDVTATHKQSTNNGENPRKQKKNKKTQGQVNDDIKFNTKDISSNTHEKTKKLKRNISEKLDNEDSDPMKRKINKKANKIFKGKESGDSNTENVNLVSKTQETNENKKKKKQHKEIETDAGLSTSDKVPSVETKKSKKKKQIAKAQNETKIEEDNENKPEVIVGNLENLSIGDNTHTLSNLLDEMTVVDRNEKKKQKKNRINKKKDKHPAETLEEIEESKREKWQKKRWNKGMRGKNDPDKGLHPVNIENLPISIILNYKKLLAEHFAKCGTVRRIGIAQIYPSDSSKPVFHTMVYFDTSAEATKALEEDNSSFEGSTIRVLRPFPTIETTAVVRTYGPLSEQIISTIFSNVGRIRRIRHLIKGKKSMATAFVELDEPEAVERAIKMADEVKVGGKKVHVSKFELHQKPKKDKKKLKTRDKVNEKKPEVNDEESDESND